ncbi:hypothetical protein ABW20_dc0107099 [Dactylellina cionopaga]|nr:hypothetical protein ABW20_dc0107099 [Dactylellina cionopaga]
MTPKTFKFRPATLANGDDSWFVEAWDSSFPFLASVGSANQWNYLPSAEPSAVERVRNAVANSDASDEKYYSSNPNGDFQHGRPPLDWCKAFVAEVDVEKDKIPDAIREKYAAFIEEGDTSGTVTIPVGAMILQAKSLAYVRSVIPEQDDEEPFLYLTFLMTDHRTGVYAKGAGAALLALAKEEVQKVGLKRLCGDCWRGNERKLVGYYEGHGLMGIGDFFASKDNEAPWPGAVVEWRL